MSQFIHAFDSANKVVKPVNVDSNGNLQVGIVGGGDATAAHQVTNHGKLDALEASLTSMEGKQDTQITHLAAIETDGNNIQSKLDKQISFCSFIKVKKYKGEFYNFDKYWIKKKDVKLIKDKIKLFDNVGIFKDVKYKWGGNSYKGIDCSALVQIFFKFNNLYCPRDTKDQVKFFQKNNIKNKYKKNNLIYWKGHVAICLNSNNLIHAYGPRKKVVTMSIKDTILEIKKKSNLKVTSIKNINDN